MPQLQLRRGRGATSEGNKYALIFFIQAYLYENGEYLPDPERRRVPILFMKTLTDRIRAAREEAGLSQADVAKALRISASAVNQWERGLIKNMKLDHFFALASLLRQDPRWLATGKGHPRTRETAAMPPAPDYPTLTSEEKALLHYFRQIPNTLRKVVLRFLRELNTIYVSRANLSH